MGKVVFFDNQNQQMDRCNGETYYNFLDYAFQKSNYFMLVYVNYYGNGYTKAMKQYMKALEPFIIKSRTNPSWPGTLKTFCPNTTYKINFYRNTPEAKAVLKQAYCLSDWSRPSYPQDLAFFRGNQCWFYSVGHEMIGAFIHADAEDINFVVTNGLASSTDTYIPRDSYYDLFDELIEQ